MQQTLSSILIHRWSTVLARGHLWCWKSFLKLESFTRITILSGVYCLSDFAHCSRLYHLPSKWKDFIEISIFYLYIWLKNEDINLCSDLWLQYGWHWIWIYRKYFSLIFQINLSKDSLVLISKNTFYWLNEYFRQHFAPLDESCLSWVQSHKCGIQWWHPWSKINQ